MGHGSMGQMGHFFRWVTGHVMVTLDPLYQAWQPDSNDADNLSVLKREFLKVLQVKYWPSLTMLHFAATFLDPSLKHFRFVTDMNDRDGFFGQVREAIVSLSKEPSTTDVPQPSASVTHNNSTTADAGDIPPTKKRKVSPFDWFQSATVTTGVSSASTATASVASLKEHVLREIRSYETEPLLCHAESNVFDPLRWWGQHGQMYPLLSDCARRLFVIPASSAECERHFSAFNARNIIRSQWNMMFPETVEALSIVLESYKNKLIR